MTPNVRYILALHVPTLGEVVDHRLRLAAVTDKDVVYDPGLG